MTWLQAQGLPWDHGAMCDVCSAREVWTDDGTSLPRDRLPDGWLIKKYDRGVVRHLCPACATRATVRHRVENDPA